MLESARSWKLDLVYGDRQQQPVHQIESAGAQLGGTFYTVSERFQRLQYWDRLSNLVTNWTHFQDMYGSQQPVKSSSQDNSGPSAPEWRLSSTMNNRSQQTWHPPSSSPPPPPVSVPTYNPNVYGTMPGVSPVHTQSAGAFASGLAMADTASWGVRFNQHSLAEIPPPVPVCARTTRRPISLDANG